MIAAGTDQLRVGDRDVLVVLPEDLEDPTRVTGRRLALQALDGGSC